MNLKGVGFVNYLYIIVLALGTWINVNIFSSILWLGILLYIYNVFCVDDRGKQYFKNLRFLIVFLMSFTSLIVIFHSYILYEYLVSPNQDTYYKEITNLGFEYNKKTSVLQQTIINILLSFTSFVLSIVVFVQLNKQEDIFEGRGEEYRASTRRTVNQQNTFQSILGKYEWAQRFITTIVVLLMMATILIDGLFGVFYSIILACWMLAKLDNRGNDLQQQIDIDKKFLQILKIFSLLTCYCSVLWKLNIFVRQYKGIVYIINGYVTSYTVLFITTFVLELFLFMFTIYAYDLLSQLNSQHIAALKLKQDKASANPSAIKTFFTGNYFGLITALCFLWANIIPSLLMFIPLLILLIGSIQRKQKDAKLKTAVAINHFSYIFLIVIIIFNIPFLFRYVTGSLLFDLLGLHSYNEEEGGVDGLLDRMGFLSMYLITITSIHYITLLKAQEKEIIHLPHLQGGLNASGVSSHHSQFHPASQQQQSEVTLPPPHRIDDEEDFAQNEEQQSLNQSHRADSQKGSSSIKHGESMINESQVSQLKKKKDKKKKSKYSLKMKAFWESFSRTVLLHLEKLNVCLVFAISIYRIDIIHAFYMLAFLFLVFCHMKYWRSIMRVIIAYSYAVIILHYTITILYESKAIKTISSTLQIIGIHKDPTIETFLTKQTFEVVIVLILTYCQANIVYVTDTYNEYRSQCIELEEEATTIQRKQEIVKKMDVLSRFFIKYGVWICYINLLSVGLIPPANILSLGYLIFLQLFISFTMYENHERKALKKIMKGFPLLVMISSFILIVRYLSLFENLNELLQQLIPSKKVIEDIGLSNEMNTLQICGNAFILLILNAQRRLIDAKLYEDMDAEDNQDAENVSNDGRITKRHHRTISYYLYSFKIKFLFFLATHFSKIVLFYGLLLSILHSSFAGVTACFIQMLIFLWGREEYWKRVWVPLWVISFTFLLAQYLFQLHIVGDHLTDNEKSWAGVFSIDSSRYWIFLVLYILQQILCVLMRKLQKFESRIEGDSYKEFLQDFNNIRECYNHEKKRLDEESNKELLEILDEEEKQKYKEEIQNKIAQQNLSLSKSKSKKDYQSGTSSPLTHLSKSQSKKQKLSGEEFSEFQKMQNQENYQIFLKWYPYKRSTELEYELKEFFKYYGYDLSIFVLIVAAYFEMNAVSLVHIILAVFFAFFSYVINSPKMYNPTLLLFVNYIWRTINYLMVIDITRKYIISIWFPSDWKIEKPWNSWQFGCDPKGKDSFSLHLNNGIADDAQKISDYDECTYDWKYWLSLEEESNLHLILDVINFQIMVIYDRYFREIYSHHGPKRCHENIISQDQHDFTRKSDLYSFIKLFIFGYFYQIPIMVYFIIGCLNNISSYTDIISIIYVFTSIYMLFKTKMLLHEKNNIWKYLLMFNTIVMVILCLYQSPIFQCPIIYPEGRYYLNSDECLQLQNSKKGQLYILEVLNRKVESSEDLYILMSHIFGFNKSEHFHFGITKEVFMIIFVLFGLLQKNLWNHPYTEHYIEPYFLEQKDKQKENAVSVVEAVHVTRINRNIQQEMELEVYDSIQQRVENKVVVWDKMVSQADHTGTHVSIPEEQQHLLQFEKSKEEVKQAKAAMGLMEEEEEGRVKQLAHSEKQYEVIMHKAEKIVLESNIPIHLNDVIRICTLYKNNNEKLEMELENLKTKNEAMIVEMVYDNNLIGIDDYKEIMQLKHQERRQKIEELLQKNLLRSDSDMEEAKESKKTEQEKEQQESESLLAKQLTYQEGQQQEEEIKQQHQPQVSAPQSVFIDEIQKKETEEKKQQKSFKLFMLKVKDVFSTIKKMIINLLCSMLVEVNKDTLILYKEKNSLSLVFIIFMQHKFQLVCCLAFILTAINNADLVSILYPMIYFIYALVESPFPTRYFWKIIMYYTILIISLKFLYQLPVFCGSPPYTFFLFSDDQSCSTTNISSEQARTRIDFIIGIRKYMGPSSYPRNQGFFFGILWDYIILLCLFVQRYLLQLEGKWTYIYLSKDECYIPQFRDPVAEYKKYRQLPIEEQMKNSFSFEGVTDATINSNLQEELDQQNDDEDKPHANVLSSHSLEQGIQEQNPTSINNQEGDDNNQQNIMNIQTDQVIHRNLIQDLNQSQDESKDEVGSLNSQQERKSVHSDDEDENAQEGEQIFRQMNFFTLFIYRLFPQYLQNFYKKSIKKQNNKFEKKSQFLSNEEQQNAQDIHDAKIEALQQKDEDIQGSKPGNNYYIHQFVTSFLVLIYFILFYNKMVSQSSTDITNESRFSRSIVIIILLCISVMVMDRILYKLRRVKTLFVDLSEAKNMVKEREKDSTQHAAIVKLIMHILITICIHIYLFFVVPNQTHSRFHNNSYLVICYILIIMYLYFSALQIRYGYPQMSVGSIFSRDTSLVYRISFIVYRALPFLYELRSIIDWTFTSTALDIFQWFKLEDAYANLYSVKAEMNVRKETHKFGQKRDFFEKCSNGFLFLVILLVVILLPIFLFSNLNPAVELNNLQQGNVRLEFQCKLTGKEYHVRIYQKNGLEVADMTSQQFSLFEDLFYGVDDLWEERLQVIKLDSFSDKGHEFNENMVKDLEQQYDNPDIEMGILIDFVFNRPKPEGKEQVKGKSVVNFNKNQIDEMKKILTAMRKDMESETKEKNKQFSIPLYQFIPFFEHILDGQNAVSRPFEPSDKRELEKYNQSLPKEVLENPNYDHNVLTATDAELVFIMQDGQYQWQIKRKPSPYLDKIIPDDDGRIAFITLSEMAFSSILRQMSDNLSVVGIYLTVVLTVGRFLRLYFNNVSMRCIWEEMPETDDLFDLCQSIYIARLEQNLLKEERNYELLIRILRSPEILMRLTGISVYDI